MDKNISRKILYNTINCQTISADGKFLFCGNSFGDIAVFNLEKVKNSIENQAVNDENPADPIYIYSEPNEQIYSLAFHKNFLISGLSRQIVGYNVNKQGKITKKSFNVKIPVSSEGGDNDEVNSLWIDKENSLLYAGCGDNNIYVISLEDGKIVKTYSGHQDYIHSVHGFENKLISASEDGSVKIWDKREKQAVHTIEPYKNENIKRTEFGKWQGSATISSDWVICGGGPKLSLWHMRTLQPTSIFSFPKELHVTDFINENILAGGDYQNLYQYNFNGDVVSEIAISGTSVMSVAWQSTPYSIMSIAGTSNNIDICTNNFTYKENALSFYKRQTASG